MTSYGCIKHTVMRYEEGTTNYPFIFSLFHEADYYDNLLSNCSKFSLYPNKNKTFLGMKAARVMFRHACRNFKQNNK